ncbi:MAG: S1/P1 Nuclease [Caulobacteraceae bacterium]
MTVYRGFILVVLAAATTWAGDALSWGATGHRIIGRAAVLALPPEVPAFLRSEAAVAAVGELAREPDRWKGAGRAHDGDLDPGHFLDVDDQGKILGGPALSALPLTREGFDTAMRAVGSDGWNAGYLPYSIVEGWQQLSRDFAYWRVDRAAAEKVADAAHRTWFRDDRVRREALILRDLGVLGHYVGDGSQPLHVTVHFNGWGNDPNPQGYTAARIHAPIEGIFVRDNIDAAAVRAAMPAFEDHGLDIGRRTAAYLATTNGYVRPLYRLYKAGGFRAGDPRGRAFITARLASGAAELRDLTVDAWRASAAAEVGWPAVKVADVEAGRADPFDSLYGTD